MNREKLEKVYNKLWDEITRRQGGVKPTSFKSGRLYEWEGYKRNVFDQGHKIMTEDVPWEEPGIVGSGKIFEAAVKCLDIVPEGDKKKQNLVSWRDIDKFKKLRDSAGTRIEEIEKALKNLYHDEEDKNAFEQLCMAVGRTFPLISYFFFLKDCEKYAVMRPIRFENYLSMIGERTECTNGATWENYQEFCRILGEVRDFLREKLPNEEITLLEAHSFLWSLWVLEENKDGNIV